MTLPDFICTIKPYDFLAWACILSGVFIFWRWHLSKDNNFDLMDLICEQGKLSSGKFMRVGSWAVMSYGFYLLAKTSPESLVGYAPLYGGIWVSARALDKWQQTNHVNLDASSKEVHETKEETITHVFLTNEQVEAKKSDFYSEGPES
jgi:hypothetical protein